MYGTPFLNSSTTIPLSNNWTSLKKLSLGGATFSDESFDKILSGCPVLESLELFYCVPLSVIDLSNKSLHLRTLDIYNFEPKARVPTKIVAPHIHCLKWKSQFPCSLADLSSLTEAKLDIIFCHDETIFFKDDFFQVMVLQMLEKLHNAEKLTLGTYFLHILSLAEIRGLTFPTLKVKALTLVTPISQYVIPSIEKILQNSPHLKKLTIHTCQYNVIREEFFDAYVDLQGLNADQCWRSKDGVAWNKSHCNPEPKHVASFMKLLLKNTKTLEKMVVQLEGHYLKFEELVRTLSHNSSVSILLSINQIY
ncbi:unnamed protein product [Thlaspi arvense]|uniref:F-box/LRR-repeat protein 15/At3g58940/PEG3-like LRR domain-containing protein n=1 Tax=Thlaspi arvense TaxID=13288 RepID=A0AAU9S358_THLAR|nr:unnamed protein product [Thlaspi arvense]